MGTLTIAQLKELWTIIRTMKIKKGNTAERIGGAGVAIIEYLEGIRTMTASGWSPILAIVSDDARLVFQLKDWIGGEGEKPTQYIGMYVGSTGFVSDISKAVDIGGVDPVNSNSGWSPILAVVADGTRQVLQLNAWTGGTGKAPSGAGMYIGSTGLVSDISQAVNIKGDSAGLIETGDSEDITFNGNGSEASPLTAEFTREMVEDVQNQQGSSDFGKTNQTSGTFYVFKLFNGILYAGSEAGISKLNPETKLWEQTNITSGFYRSFGVSPEGILYAGGSPGVVYLSDGVFLQDSVTSDCYGFGKDSEGSLYVSASDKIYKLDGSVWQSTTDGLTGNEYRGLGLSPLSGMLYACSRNGILQLNQSSGWEQTNITSESFMNFGLSPDDELFATGELFGVVRMNSSNNDVWEQTNIGFQKMDSFGNSSDGELYVCGETVKKWNRSLLSFEDTTSPVSIYQSFGLDSNGAMYVSAYGGISRVDGLNISPVNVPIANFYGFGLSAENRLYVGSNKGIFIDEEPAVYARKKNEWIETLSKSEIENKIKKTGIPRTIKATNPRIRETNYIEFDLPSVSNGETVIIEWIIGSFTAPDDFSIKVKMDGIDDSGVYFSKTSYSDVFFRDIKQYDGNAGFTYLFNEMDGTMFLTAPNTDIPFNAFTKSTQNAISYDTGMGLLWTANTGAIPGQYNLSIGSRFTYNDLYGQQNNFLLVLDTNSTISINPYAPYGAKQIITGTLHIKPTVAVTLTWLTSIAWLDSNGVAATTNPPPTLTVGKTNVVVVSVVKEADGTIGQWVGNLAYTY